MTRLNRMSMDSDFLVDRRIVIKLLLTFFQRNHSKEVLDLMVRMLGFSDEDKQRIGVAQLGGKSVVHGVLGLPGRLVGGLLGGSVADGQTNLASDDQICGLIFYSRKLKKGKRGDLGKKIQVNPMKVCKEGVQMKVCPTMEPSISGIAGPNIVQSDSEFSTVPLTPFDNSSRISKLH